jgi:hypothetical protein
VDTTSHAPGFGANSIHARRAKPFRFGLVSLLIPLTLVACGGGGGGGVSTPPPPATYSVVANVSGLSGAGLVLALGNGANINVAGNGSVNLATGLADGATYSVIIGLQPTNPVQTCTITNNNSGAISGANASVTVACVASAAGTVNVTPATVGIDSSIPASATAAISNIVSPLDTQKPGTSLFVPISVNGGESMVFATDANNNIMLASLLTTNSVNLNANSTALALTRVLMGSLPSTASSSDVNNAIQGTAEFPNLVSLISAALSAGTPPSTSSAIATSIGTVTSQLPASVLATLAKARNRVLHAAASPVAQPSVTTANENLFTTSASGTVTGAVAVVDTTPSGGVQISNTTAIAWTLSSATTSGQALCDGGDGPPSGNPTCAVTIPRTSLVSYVKAGSVSTGAIGGNGEAFNVTLYQGLVSRDTNVLQVDADIIQVLLGFATAGADAPAAECIASVQEAFFPAAQVAMLIVNPLSSDTWSSYVKEVLTSPLSLIKAYNGCSGVVTVQLPTGINPVGGVTWQSALSGFINYASNTALGLAVGEAFVGVTAAAIPSEVSQMISLWSFSGVAGICESPQGQGYQVSNCIASLAFTPSSVTLVPNSIFTPGLAGSSAGANGCATPNSSGTEIPELAILDINGCITLASSDLQYSSPNTDVVGVNPDGEVVALVNPGGTTSAPATVTVTQQSTSISASYMVTVNSVPTLTLSSNPASLPATGGSVTFTATLGPPAGAIPGSPTPATTVTLIDGSGATLCTATINTSGEATCSATIVSAPEAVTANYSGDANYSPASVSTTVTVTADPQWFGTWSGPENVYPAVATSLADCTTANTPFTIQITSLGGNMISVSGDMLNAYFTFGHSPYTLFVSGNVAAPAADDITSPTLTLTGNTISFSISQFIFTFDAAFSSPLIPCPPYPIILTRQ